MKIRYRNIPIDCVIKSVITIFHNVFDVNNDFQSTLYSDMYYSYRSIEQHTHRMRSHTFRIQYFPSA